MHCKVSEQHGRLPALKHGGYSPEQQATPSCSANLIAGSKCLTGATKKAAPNSPQRCPAGEWAQQSQTAASATPTQGKRASQQGGQTPDLSAWKAACKHHIFKMLVHLLLGLSSKQSSGLCVIFLEQTSFQPNVLGYSGHFWFLRKLAACFIT